jgi:hypothetical protein
VVHILGVNFVTDTPTRLVHKVTVFSLSQNLARHTENGRAVALRIGALGSLWFLRILGFDTGI